MHSEKLIVGVLTSFGAPRTDIHVLVEEGAAITRTGSKSSLVEVLKPC